MDNHECRENLKKIERREERNIIMLYHAIMYIVCDVISWIFLHPYIKNKYFKVWHFHRNPQKSTEVHRNPQQKSTADEDWVRRWPLPSKKSRKKSHVHYFRSYLPLVMSSLLLRIRNSRFEAVVRRLRKIRQHFMQLF